MKLEYIEWCDAVTNAGWHSKEEAADWGDNSDWVICEAGWIVKETKEYICFASGWKPADPFTEEQFVNLHKVPKTWIRRRKALKA